MSTSKLPAPDTAVWTGADVGGAAVLVDDVVPGTGLPRRFPVPAKGPGGGGT